MFARYVLLLKVVLIAFISFFHVMSLAALIFMFLSKLLKLCNSFLHFHFFFLVLFPPLELQVDSQPVCCKGCSYSFFLRFLLYIHISYSSFWFIFIHFYIPQHWFNGLVSIAIILYGFLIIIPQFRVFQGIFTKPRGCELYISLLLVVVACLFCIYSLIWWPVGRTFSGLSHILFLYCIIFICTSVDIPRR